MFNVPLLTWISAPRAKAPTASVAANFTGDPQYRIQLRGAYLDNLTDAKVVAVDNTQNANNVTVIFGPNSQVVSAQTRVSFPVPHGLSYMEATAAAGNTTLIFYADARDAPPDQPNYLAIIQTAVSSVVPPGIISPYGGAVAPTGYLLCDGTAVSRVTYVDLFTAIGIAYGPGDGLTTFNLPDGRDRAFIGASPGALGADRPTARAIGAGGGNEKHTLISGEVPATAVTIAGTFYDTVSGAANGSVVGGGTGGTAVGAASISGTVAGGGGAHSSVNPFFVGNWIIKI